MTIALTLAALLLYVVAGLLIWTREATGSAERLLPAGAIVLHAYALWMQVFEQGGITIGINEALSLFTWQSAVLLWAFCLREPLRILGVFIYPLAGFCAAWAGLLPTPTTNLPALDWKTRLHIILSLLSAGLLTLAAVQASALAMQERLLQRHRQATRLTRSLPALQTMEGLLFQLIGVGFFLLSLTLLSGLWFLQDWLSQHLAHKTVLSITAWLIFGTLLWGRWRHGWRGRTAIRWALSGYGMLILAYFGSKLILEQILGRHWT